jgi:hypothetical protein
MNITLVIALIVLAAINAAVTLFVARAGGFTLKQKIAQSSIVWCVPILGSILVFAVFRSDRERKTAEVRSNHIAETNDIGRYL